MTTKKKFELDFKKLREDIDLEQLNNDLIGYRDQIARLREASNKSMDISKQCAESRKAEISLPPPPDYDAIGVWGHVKPASYTDESLREYGQACREQALEDAAQACESAIASIWDYHDDGRKQLGTTVCNNLAAAIRQIKEQP